MHYQRNVYVPLAPHQPTYYVNANQKSTNKMLAQLLVDAERESNIGFEAEPIPKRLGLSWQQVAVIIGAYAVWGFFFYKLFAA